MTVFIAILLGVYLSSIVFGFLIWAFFLIMLYIDDYKYEIIRHMRKWHYPLTWPYLFGRVVVNMVKDIHQMMKEDRDE